MLKTRLPSRASRVSFIPRVHKAATDPRALMRLLKYGDYGCLTITTFNETAIPYHAILLHTWGEDTEEVTFADLAQGNGKHKSSCKKILFLWGASTVR